MSEQPTIQKTPELNPFDLDQQRKRVASVLKTAEGRQAIRDALLNTKEGTEIVKTEFGIAVVHASAKDKPIVAILIPTHKKPENETGTALERMIPVAREHAHIVMRPSIASSVVHWVRNQLLSQLYKEKLPFDYVLFMDDDMYPPPHALSTLLNRNVDIVGAVCTVRQDPPLPNARHFNADQFLFQTADIDQRGLWQVGAIGTGFLLVSKKALDAIGEYTVQQRYYQKYFGISEELRAAREKAHRKIANEAGNYWWFECLKHPLGEGEYGEDISFCFKARECGLDVYADSSFSVGHLGNYPFSIEDYWAYREDAIKRGLVVSLAGTRAQSRIPAEELPEDCKKISILCPTRGRPESIKRLVESIKATADVMPEIIFYADHDDEKMVDPETGCPRDVGIEYDDKSIRLFLGERRTLSDYWNECAKVATGDILMNCGDDVVFKTKGWDTMVKHAFAQFPDRIIFAHGDDGHWGEKFGTHGFVHRKWIDAVGYFIPPYFSSDYGDTWLNEVANTLGRRAYMPFVTEHLHFLWGKAEKDQTHIERLERHQADNVKELYKTLAPERAQDVEKLRAVMAKPVEELVPVG